MDVVVRGHLHILYVGHRPDLLGNSDDSLCKLRRAVPALLLSAYALLSFLMFVSSLFKSLKVANLLASVCIPLLGILFFAIQVSRLSIFTKSIEIKLHRLFCNQYNIQVLQMHNILFDLFVAASGQWHCDSSVGVLGGMYISSNSSSCGHGPGKRKMANTAHCVIFPIQSNYIYIFYGIQISCCLLGHPL